MSNFILLPFCLCANTSLPGARKKKDKADQKKILIAIGLHLIKLIWINFKLKKRFFNLVKEFKNNPEIFSVEYRRKSPKRIDKKLEQIILKELEKDKDLINNKDIPIDNFNYTYLKDQIYEKYNLTVSVPKIIKRSKEYKFYIQKKNQST